MSGISISGQVTLTNTTKSPNRKIIKSNSVTYNMAYGLAYLMAGSISNNTISSNRFRPYYIKVASTNTPDSVTIPENSSFSAEGSVVSPPNIISYVTTSITSVNISEQKDINSKITNLIVNINSYIAPNLLSDGYQIIELGLYSTDNGKDFLLAQLTYPNSGNRIIAQSGYGVDISWNIIISPGNDDVIKSVTNGGN